MKGVCDAPMSPRGGRHIAPRTGFGGDWTPPNKRMHATADTLPVIIYQRCGAARDARR